jgi:membrane-bound lytic murein transglycosylase D
MRYTISNKQVLTFFLSLAIPAIVGGCAAVPEQNAQVTSPTESQASTVAASALKPPAASAAVAAGASAPLAAKVASPIIIGEPGLVPTGEPTTAVISALREELAIDEPSVSAPPDSLWARIRAGLRLPRMESSVTRQHEQWFMENVEFREAMFERSKLYLYYIVEEVEKRGMPMEIALLPAIESAYKPYAYSRAKASGLWQFIPSTGRLYGLKTNWWYDGRRDVIASTRAALDYLKKLQSEFNGDWQLALAAYNAGEGRVARAIEWNRRKGLPTDFVHLKQLRIETKHYVPKLMAMANIVTEPQRFGIQLPDVPNEPYFTTVETNSQVDLGVIARLTGMEVDQLHFINPGYTRWTTDPNGHHHVLVPVDKKDALLAGLSSLPDSERVQWMHHEVRRGETLYSIAHRYSLTVDAIKTSNKIGGSLRVGQDLLLPISATARVVPIAAPGNARSVRSTTPGNQPIVHKVRSGETLTSIARRYNVLVHQLATWNFMEPNDVLRHGRKLKIWTDDGPQAHHRHLDTTVYA